MTIANPTQSTSVGSENDFPTLLALRKMASHFVILYAALAIFHAAMDIYNPTSNNAAVTCGYLAIAVSLAPIFFAFWYKKTALVFSCIAAFNVAPIWFLYLECVLKGYDSYVYNSPDERMNALFWIAIFQLFANLFYYIFWKTFTRISLKEFRFITKVKLSPKFYHRFTLIVFVVPLICFYYFYDSYEILWKAMTAGRSGGGSAGGLIIYDGAVGNSSSLMLPLNILWTLTPLFATIAYYKSSQRITFQTVITLLMGGWVIFSFFLSGSRGDFISVITPVLFFIVFNNWNKGIKFWIPLGLIFIFLIAIMELQVRFRGNLLDVLANPEKAARANNLKSATTFNPAESHRDNNMYLFCLLVKGYPKKYPFEGYTEFYATLVNPIPRYFWPGKPLLLGAQDITYQPAFIRDGPITMGTTSLSISIVGDAYKAGGLLGIIIYTFIYSLIFIFLDGIIYYTKGKEPLAIGLLGISLFLCFWGTRAFFALVTSLYPILLFLLIIRISKLFKKT